MSGCGTSEICIMLLTNVTPVRLIIKKKKKREVHVGEDLGGFPICEMGMRQALPKRDILGLQRNQKAAVPAGSGGFRGPAFLCSLGVTWPRFARPLRRGWRAHAPEAWRGSQGQSGNEDSVLGPPEPNPGIWRRQAGGLGLCWTPHSPPVVTEPAFVCLSK